MPQVVHGEQRHEQRPEAEVVDLPALVHRDAVPQGRRGDRVLDEPREEPVLEEVAPRRHRERQRRDRQERPRMRSAGRPMISATSAARAIPTEHRGEEVPVVTSVQHGRRGRAEADERELTERDVARPPREDDERHRDDRVDVDEPDHLFLSGLGPQRQRQDERERPGRAAPTHRPRPRGAHGARPGSVEPRGSRATSRCRSRPLARRSHAARGAQRG